MIDFEYFRIYIQIFDDDFIIIEVFLFLKKLENVFPVFGDIALSSECARASELLPEAQRFSPPRLG